VATQVINAGCGDLRVVLRLGQYERALEDRLRVQSEAFCSPFRAKAALPHRLGDVGLDLCCMPVDAGFASGSNCRARLKRLLHHCAYKARELGNVAREQLLSEIKVSEHALEWVCLTVIGCALKKLACDFGPMLGGRHRQVSLALEVVEEGAFGDIARRAQV